MRDALPELPGPASNARFYSHRIRWDYISQEHEEMKSTGRKTTLTPKLRFPEFRDGPGWETLSLEELGEFVSERVPVSELTRANYVSTENLLPDFGGLSIAASLPSLATVVRYRKNDILAANIRPYLKKIWLADRDGGASNDVIVIRAYSEVGHDYLSQVLKNDRFITYVMSGVKGLKMPRGDVSLIRGYRVPISSPAEQHKIADCLTSLDELIGAERQKLDALRTQKKGLMEQLFPREGESRPRLRFPEFWDSPEWEEKTLTELFHFQDGFSFKSTDFTRSAGDATQVIRITDINNRNKNTDKVYVSNVFLNSINLRKYYTERGDLLLSLTGAAGFNYCIWDSETSLINQRTTKITPKDKLNQALISLLEPLSYDKINARGEGQNNNLSREFLNSVTLPIPRPAEQQRIASCLTSFDDLVSAQAQKLDALKLHKKGLMQQIFPSQECET
jgi:type I restriction enzyme S subunit